MHITIADEDGDGYPSFDVDRWSIEVRSPLTDDEAEAAAVARVTAFTVRAPDEVEEIVEALETSDAQGSYSSVGTGTDPNGGPFFSLFVGATEDLPHLVPAIVSAVQNGRAGRMAGFVLADPTQWTVALTGDDLDAVELAAWAETVCLLASTRSPMRPTSGPRT